MLRLLPPLIGIALLSVAFVPSGDARTLQEVARERAARITGADPALAEWSVPVANTQRNVAPHTTRWIPRAVESVQSLGVPWERVRQQATDAASRGVLQAVELAVKSGSPALCAGAEDVVRRMASSARWSIGDVRGLCVALVTRDSSRCPSIENALLRASCDATIAPAMQS